jgi:twitching motility protein PilT
LALTAAETGHLVFGTLHTNSAAKTIDRIIDVFPEGQQQQIRTMLSESLRGVIAQTLFARADGHGRVAAYEVMRGTKAIANLIRENKVHQIASQIQTGQNLGMVLFEKSVGDLVKKGLVTQADANSFLGKEGDETGKPEVKKKAG